MRQGLVPEALRVVYKISRTPSSLLSRIKRPIYPTYHTQATNLLPQSVPLLARFRCALEVTSSSPQIYTHTHTRYLIHNVSKTGEGPLCPCSYSHHQQHQQQQAFSTCSTSIPSGWTVPPDRLPYDSSHSSVINRRSLFLFFLFRIYGLVLLLLCFTVSLCKLILLPSTLYIYMYVIRKYTWLTKVPSLLQQSRSWRKSNGLQVIYTH